jgi:hypothetical protein
MSYRDGFDEHLAQQFRNAAEAAEFTILPAGEYVADAVDGVFDKTKNGVAELKITFQVVEPGEFVGQRFWWHLYLSPKALPMSKRDLHKFGITDLAQLRDRWPAIWRCRTKVTLQASDQGRESNRVQLLEVLGRADPGPEPFAPTNGDLASLPAPAKPVSAADPFSQDADIPF